MPYTQHDRTIALAGIFQVAHLVKKLAWEGKTNTAAMSSSLESLLKFDADNVLSVFGDISSIIDGLRTLQDQLDNHSSKRDHEITRYALTLMHIERKLSTSPEMLDKITRDLESVKGQLDYFDLSHSNTIAKLAEIYKSTISTLQPRIIVEGEQVYLSSNENANKIRALLLAGIRACVLWRQTGGSRWQFIFSRKKYLQSASYLANKI